MNTQFSAPQSFQAALASGIAKLNAEEAARRIWEQDASFWKADPVTQALIKHRLGWLTVANTMQEKSAEITDLADAVRQAGYKSAVLLGVSGSSLCPEVLRLTFGTAPGSLNLFVLDTTDPDTIHQTEQQIDLHTTLFIVASKSGGTLETMSHFKYFYDKVHSLIPAQAGEHFIAITDPDTSLEKLAQEHNFRHIFSNPPDIGGRYSALSFFGLVPGALIGVDIKELLTRAQQMIVACAGGFAARAYHDAAGNLGLWLGAVLGSLGTLGHNKITFAISPEISSYRLWVEQLIAESTDKEGRGFLSVEGEQLGDFTAYGDDRLFVYIRMQNGDNDTLDSRIETLQASGQPVVRLNIRDRYDLGGEFFRWEMATAIAGFFLDINPFDEPNAQKSKDNTKRSLAQFGKEGHLHP